MLRRHAWPSRTVDVVGIILAASSTFAQFGARVHAFRWSDVGEGGDLVDGAKLVHRRRNEVGGCGVSIYILLCA